MAVLSTVINLSRRAMDSLPAVRTRVVHLDVEDQIEELLRQLSYAIKNQLKAPKAPY